MCLNEFHPCCRCGWDPQRNRIARERIARGLDAARWPFRYCRRCGHDSFHRCDVCGAVEACPEHDLEPGQRLVSEDEVAAAGLPMPQWRAAELPRLPTGYRWLRGGSAWADRVRQHGGATAHIGQCEYVAIAKEVA